METDRRFNEREVGAVIKRTAELQAGEPSAGLAEGATLTQLQQAASELGLDPLLVARAASEIEQAPVSGFWVRLIGGPWEASADFWVDGAVTDANWPMLLARIREVSGRVGSPEAVAGAFEWLSKEPDPLHVSIIPQGGRTRVRAGARFGRWAGAHYVLALVLSMYPAVLAGTFFGADKPALGALAALIPVFLFAVARVGLGRVCGIRRRQFAGLTQAIGEWIGSNGEAVRTSDWRGLASSSARNEEEAGNLDQLLKRPN